MTLTIPRSLRRAVRGAMRRRSPVFTDYETALSHTRDGGYENERIAAVVHAKTERMAADPDGCDALTPPASRATLAGAILLAKALCPERDVLRVLDFGGACGAHYFTARYLVPHLRVTWCVVETRAMVAAARSLENGSLMFAESIAAARSVLGEVDLVYSSGALPYLPDPESGLRELVAAGAPVLALARMALTPGPPFVWIQESRLSANGPGPMPAGMPHGTAAYPGAVLNRQRVEQFLQTSYDIVSYRDESSDQASPRGRVLGSAYLCLRKEPKPA